MKRILLIFWPENGNVERVTDLIVSKLSDLSPEKKSVANINTELLTSYDHWIIGGSTVGSHVWEDANDSNRWFSFFKMIDKIDLTKKVVAFYGLGDQVLYPHHFVDGLAVLQEEFEKRKVKIVGQWPVDGYNFIESAGIKGNHFYGLALDEDNQYDLTESRIDKWLTILKNSIL
jgi:flavodoxin I